jgi:hypothetical protein
MDQIDRQPSLTATLAGRQSIDTSDAEMLLLMAEKVAEAD